MPSSIRLIRLRLNQPLFGYPAGAVVEVEDVDYVRAHVTAGRAVLAPDTPLRAPDPVISRDELDGVLAGERMAAMAAFGPLALADAPTFRTRPPRPTWLSTFQAGHGWTDPLGGGTIAADTTDFVLGSQSVTLDNAAGTNTALDRSGLTIDLTDRAMAVLIKLDRLDTNAYFTVYAADAGFTNYYSWEVRRSTDASAWFRQGEWALVTLPVENATVVGTPNRAALTRLRARVFGSGKFHINAIGHVPAAKTTWPNGLVSITFDDGYDDFIQAARRSLTPRGLAATSYTIPSLIGQHGFMTEAELSELRHRHGWDIQAHGEDVYTGLTADQMRAEWSATKAWFAERGLGNPQHLAYVGGQNNDAVVSVAREFFATARTVASRQAETWPPPMPHRLRALTGISGYAGGVNVAAVQAAIDKAKAGGHWLILVFHRIVDTPTSTVECSWADLNAVLDYINTSGVEVRTVADAFAR